jgi:Protein of unknown function (DUF2971)
MPLTPNTKFFKYYRFDQYGIEAVYNNTLWLSNPQFFKDPYDSHLNFLTNINKNNDSDLMMKKEKEIRNGLGICCFTKTWSNPRMWKEYADNHAGFCIEYDLSVLENSLNRMGLPLLIEPVHYVHQYSNDSLPRHLKERLGKEKFSDFDAKDYDNYVQGLILTKDKRLYAHEDEIRLIMSEVLVDRIGNNYLVSKEKEGYSVSLPNCCMKSIYFGAKSSEINQRHMLQHLSQVRHGAAGTVDKKWVGISPHNGHLHADRYENSDLSEIISGNRIYGDPI